MSGSSLRLAIVVRGRFHAFDLAKALIGLGHDVTVFTNYPVWMAGEYGLPRRSFKSFLFNGVASRALYRFRGPSHAVPGEAWIHRSFGNWAARELAQEKWDAIHAFSGVAEESFKAVEGTGTLRTLSRSSAHIRTQARLLEDEEARAGVRIDRPTGWMVAREEREYTASDVVVVPSIFAERTFLERGFPSAKLTRLPLSADLALFASHPAAAVERTRRILDGEPLRVLTVGTFSFRKGAVDLAAIASAAGKGFSFRFVGDIAAEAAQLAARARPGIRFFGRLPASELLPHFEWADVFLFPTIEDGFAVVLAQARAAGLPLLATDHCASTEMIEGGRFGWALPIRRPDLFLEKLRWCDSHRPELSRVAGEPLAARRDWGEVARDFVSICSTFKRD